MKSEKGAKKCLFWLTDQIFARCNKRIFDIQFKKIAGIIDNVVKKQIRMKRVRKPYQLYQINIYRQKSTLKCIAS